METSTTLCTVLLLFFSAYAEVVERFEDDQGCVKFFYQRMVPDWGASTPGVVRICQRYVNRYHFATLYDTHNRIPVYSAYQFQRSNGGGRPKGWFIEPQLVNRSWEPEMVNPRRLKGRGALGERQALNKDYNGSGFDRGHLNPNGHHAGTSRIATFTLTNVVPQNRKLNKGAWQNYESELTKLFKTCSQAFVIVGAIPSEDKWIVKEDVNRVNIPKYMWNAYCCLDNNDRPIKSGAAIAENTEDGEVKKISLDEIGEFLDECNPPELFDNNCTYVNNTGQGFY